MTRQQDSVASTFADWLVAEIDQKDLGNVPWQRDGILIDTAWWRSSPESAMVSVTLQGSSEEITRDLELALNDGASARVAQLVSEMLAS